VERRLRAAVPPADRRPLRREPQPAQHYYQYQVILKPSPPDLQDLYLGSLAEDRHRSAEARHPLRRGRLGEPDAGRLGAWLGSLVRRDGGHPVHLFPAGRRVRLQAGVGRADLRARAAGDVYPGRRQCLRPRLQRRGVTYGDVFLENEKQLSAWNFEVADTEILFDLFRKAARSAKARLKRSFRSRPMSRRSRPATSSTLAAGARSDLGRRAPGLYRPGARPRQRRVRGVDGLERVGGMSGLASGATSDTRADFLLELRSEEIPARMQAGARNALARMLAEELEQAGLSSEAIDVFSTPRRLALIARGLPLQTEARSEEVKGPRTSAPDKAVDGFLRKTGLKREQLEERDGVYFAAVDTPGQATKDLLGPMVERIVRAFPGPSRCAGAKRRKAPESLRWVRPLHGHRRDARRGDRAGGDRRDRVRRGDARPPVPPSRADHHRRRADYAQKLKACHVIVDQDERETMIREGRRRRQRRPVWRWSRTRGWWSRMPG
jgi:hypothetical protein